MGLTFRAATDADLDSILAAEAALHDTPWTAGNFRDSLTASHRLVIAEDEGQLVAYAVTSQVLDEAELLTIGVLEASQRRGVGRALLAHLIDQLRLSGTARLFLEVRAGNLPAHNLYVQRGFVEIGRRRGYYAAGAPGAAREDALVMALELSVHE